MDKNLISPYIRRAMHSTLTAPFHIYPRVLYDYEVIFVKDGACLIRIDGSDYICKKNNVVFLPPNVVHSFHSVENKNFIQPHIHFDVIYSDKSRITPISFKNRENMTPDEIGLIQKNFFSDINIPYVFVPSDPARFQSVFFRIIDAYREGAEMALSVKSDMLKLLELIITQFEHTHSDVAPVAHTVANTVKNYIDNNYFEPVSLDFLADLFHINKFTMMRRFKTTYGISIMKYYNNKRIAAAMKMLQDTNMTVKGIGETLHFTDAYSFSRFFKDEIGMSPQKYREKNT